jgi:hypothetical protein
MRILDPIVLPSTALIAAVDPKVVGGGAIRAQVVGDHSIRSEAIFLQKFAHQFQRGMLVSLGLDQHIEDLAFGVDGSPQIDQTAADFQIGFVEMPGRVGLRSPFAQVCCDTKDRRFLMGSGPTSSSTNRLFSSIRSSTAPRD